MIAIHFQENQLVRSPKRTTLVQVHIILLELRMPELGLRAPLPVYFICTTESRPCPFPARHQTSTWVTKAPRLPFLESRTIEIKFRVSRRFLTCSVNFPKI